jgi:hypothetical protein
MKNKIQLLYLIFLISISAFAVPESTEMLASPVKPIQFEFKEGQSLNDYAISANGKVFLALVNSQGKSSIIFLERTPNSINLNSQIPFEQHALAVVSHPEKSDQWFVLCRESKDKGSWSIWSLKSGSGKLQKELIFKSELPLRRLLISARPFYATSDYQKKELFYRLVFARKNNRGIWHMESIRETKDHSLLSLSIDKAPPGPWICPPGATKEQIEDGYDCKYHYSSVGEPKGALPLSFHPNGSVLNYEAGGCGKKAVFNSGWSSSKVDGCQDTSFFHPSGVITWAWNKGKTGITLDVHPREKKGTKIFTENLFIMPPVFLPDGRSAAVLLETDKKIVLKVLPYKDPYGAILNLWRFEVPEKALDQIVTIGGVLLPAKSPGSYSRPANFFHEVYDYINYTGEGKIPPIVLTDPFWYTASIAIEVGFIYMERNGAIPAYRKFLSDSIVHLRGIKKRTPIQERWLQVFINADDIIKDNQKAISPDVKLCLAGKGVENVPTLGKEFDFSECKPRSHYSNDPVLASYWRSFQYLTKGTAYTKEDSYDFSVSLLSGFPDLPESVLLSAKKWITSYEKWKAPSTYPGLQEKVSSRRWTSKHPFRKCGLKPDSFASAILSLFPLGWGQDDEVMCQLLDNQPVANPSLGEWVKAISGTSVFDELFTKVRKELPWNEWQKSTADYYAKIKDESFYGNYLAGIRLDLLSHKPIGIFQAIDEKFLKVRSILSATGGWTHLKHTLQLVSETPSASQGGQGGPDSVEVLMPEIPPAAVEPRPEVFTQQKKILEMAISLTTPYIVPDEVEVLNQMKSVSDELSLFARAAQDQKEGKLIDGVAGEHARDLGRFLDHKDIFFNGILSPGYSVAREKEDLNMGIIASVSQANSNHGYTATGRPLLAYFAIEEAGKRRLVLGSTFSVYFFEKKELITDKEWQKTVLPGMKFPEEYSGFVK